MHVHLKSDDATCILKLHLLFGISVWVIENCKSVQSEKMELELFRYRQQYRKMYKDGYADNASVGNGHASLCTNQIPCFLLVIRNGT